VVGNVENQMSEVGKIRGENNQAPYAELPRGINQGEWEWQLRVVKKKSTEKDRERPRSGVPAYKASFETGSFDLKQ